jgi:hypothetical protein
VEGPADSSRLPENGFREKIPCMATGGQIPTCRKGSSLFGMEIPMERQTTVVLYVFRHDDVFHAEHFAKLTPPSR